MCMEICSGNSDVTKAKPHAKSKLTRIKVTNSVGCLLLIIKIWRIIVVVFLINCIFNKDMKNCQYTGYSHETLV